MTFALPAVLWALLALPILLFAEWRLSRADGDRTARLVARPLWARLVRGPHPRWRPARLVLLSVGFVALVVALARPQYGILREKIEREGVDVVLLLDTSGSMATEDVAPSRFFLAREAMTSLVSRLPEDRFALVAFEGEAYPLVPLTLDADAVGLFLETLEPGVVPAPGSSIGAGLARSLELFVDKERVNKVLVLVSDGEDLEGDVDEAIAAAKKAGVVVHAVAVGTEHGAPVPQFDDDGRKVGFKRDENDEVVVSRMHPETLAAIAKGTGGSLYRISPTDVTLSALAKAVESLEERSLRQEFTTRRRERYQLPLALAIFSFAVALLLPPPPLRRRRRSVPRAAVAAVLVLGFVGEVPAQTAGVPVDPGAAGSPTSVPAGGSAAPAPPPAPPRSGASAAVDEMLLRPRRRTSEGIRQWERGDHPAALRELEAAARSRPNDPQAQLNLGEALYRNGKLDEAEKIFRTLGADPKAKVAPAARHNLGDVLYRKEDFKGAAGSFRDALKLQPEAADTRQNLELALRAIQQQEQQKQQQQNEKQDEQKKDEQQKQKQQQQQPRNEKQKEEERFQRETGMSKERAMQLLDALQQNEKGEQKKAMATGKKPRKKRRDW